MTVHALQPAEPTDPTQPADPTQPPAEEPAPEETPAAVVILLVLLGIGCVGAGVVVVIRRKKNS